MKVKLSMDDRGLKAKPDNKKDIVAARYRTAGGWQEIDIEGAAWMIGGQGHAVIPGCLEGGMKSDNCVGMQVFMLDFDCGVRFRVAFVHDFLIKEPFVIKTAIAMLLSIFPEADTACRDLARMFFGGKELFYSDTSAHFALVQIQLPFLRSLDTGDNYCRKIKEFCRKQKVALFNNRPAMGGNSFFQDFSETDGKRDSLIIHTIGDAGFPSFCVAEGVILHQSFRCRQDERRLEIKEESGCRLLDDFNAGTEVSHQGRFAILTNLMQVKGGRKHFYNKMEEFYSESVEKWKKDAHCMKGYFPQRCSPGFCPYYGNCENMGNIVRTMAMDRKIYREDEKYVSLEEAAGCLEKNLYRAFESAGKGIHLIRAQTGIGKTETYIRMVKRRPGEKFIIAVPTINLKEEVYRRLTRAGVPPEEIFETMQISGNPFIPGEIQDSVAGAHNRGEHGAAKEIVEGYYKEIKEDAEKRATAEECRKYLAGLQELKNERIIVTTHAYFVNMPEISLQGYTVIIDEDILQLYIFKQMAKVGINSLQALAGRNYPVYSEIAKQLPAAKYIILSATLNEKIYWQYFHKSMEIYSYPYIKAGYKGRLVQFGYHFLGRRDLKGKMQVFSYALGMSGDKDVPVITFKEMGGQKELKGVNLSDIHFGNSTGTDGLKGSSLVVVGTPYSIPEAYKLPACYLGADVNQECDRQPKIRRVKYHNASFLL